MQEQKTYNLSDLQIAGLLFAKPSIPASVAFHLMSHRPSNRSKTGLLVSLCHTLAQPVTSIGNIQPPFSFHKPPIKSPARLCREGLDQTKGRYATFMPLWVSIKCCTTPGSAKVEMSPKPSYSPVAILRKIRRMILPERVFGKPGAH